MAKHSPLAERVEWVGPAYWDGRNSVKSPKKLGPGTVLYASDGLFDHGQDFSKFGIFYGKQQWNLK
jgi:hypothetical protein